MLDTPDFANIGPFFLNVSKCLSPFWLHFEALLEIYSISIRSKRAATLFNASHSWGNADFGDIGDFPKELVPPTHRF